MFRSTCTGNRLPRQIFTRAIQNFEGTKMSRRRTPDHIKLIKGTYQPCRARTAPDATSDPAMLPLPEPPDRLPEGVRNIWREIAADAPHLCAGDQLFFEVICTLAHQARTDPDMPAARIGLLRHMMADCYLTPSTRHNLPPAPEPGKFDDF